MDASTESVVHIRKSLTAVAVIAVALLQGCANYQVRVADGKVLGEEYESGMMNAYVWGYWMTPLSMSAETCKRGMYDVVVKGNYLHDLASVFTLGLWMPMEVGFRCKAPGVQPVGELPP